MEDTFESRPEPDSAFMFKFPGEQDEDVDTDQATTPLGVALVGADVVNIDTDGAQAKTFQFDNADDELDAYVDEV